MLIKYYADLTSVLFITDLSPEFVSAGIILSIHEEEIIRNTLTTSYLEISHTRSFISMLDIMENKGTVAIAELAHKIKSEL